MCLPICVLEGSLLFELSAFAEFEVYPQIPYRIQKEK